MKRYLSVLLLLTAVAFGQSLGEAARAARAKKPDAPRPNERVYTNESLSLLHGKTSEVSVVGANHAPTATDTAKKDDEGKEKAGGESKDAAAAADEQKKQLAESITKTKADIEQLTRELDVLQRENRLRAATYYADAGTRLRDQGKYAADDLRYQQEIQAKQSAIKSAQQQLDTLREQARRMGVPAS
jgi:chromosome segregation ATPase